MIVSGLQNKVVVVIGGAGLLGREFVKVLAQQSCHVVLADKSIKDGRRVLAAIGAKNTRSVFLVQADLTSRSSLLSLVRQTRRKYGRIDALVNCAYPRNRHYGRTFDRVAYKDFCENVDLHLGGYFLSCQVFGEYFKKQGHGNIINLGSIYGVVAPRFELYDGTGMSNPVEYAVIKAGVIHLTRYLAKFYKGKNIRANCISPGGVLNGQPQAFLKRYKRCCLSRGMLDPADINGALLFLLSDASKAVNGQNIVVDDGFVL